METMNDTTSADPPPPFKQPGNRLTRSTDDKVVGGLAGGLGRWFGVDPVVLRIAFVVLTLAGGSGMILYLVGWLLIPDDAGGAALNRFGNERNSKLAAAVIAGVGVLLLLDDLDGDHGDVPLGLVLVGLGGLFLWSRRNSGAGGAPPAPPSPPAPPTTEPGEAQDTPTLTVPEPAERLEPPAGPGATASTPRSVIVPVTLSLLAILAGGLSLIGVSVTTALALALLLTGAALVLGAWRGRARWLIPVGVVLALALAGASAIGDGVPLRGGTGEVTFRPLTLEEVRSPYRLAAGELVVDLSALDLGGQTVTVVASLAAGHLDIVVPAGVAIDVDGHVGAGEMIVFSRMFEGFDVGRTIAEPGREGAGRLVLRLRVGMGQVEVRRGAA